MARLVAILKNGGYVS